MLTRQILTEWDANLCNLQKQLSVDPESRPTHPQICLGIQRVRKEIAHYLQPAPEISVLIVGPEVGLSVESVSRINWGPHHEAVEVQFNTTRDVTCSAYPARPSESGLTIVARKEETSARIKVAWKDRPAVISCAIDDSKPGFVIVQATFSHARRILWQKDHASKAQDETRSSSVKDEIPF